MSYILSGFVRRQLTFLNSNSSLWADTIKSYKIVIDPKVLQTCVFVTATTKVENAMHIIVSNLNVKQRCVFKQFIVINDNLEVDARVFKSNNQNGEESKTAERESERASA